MSANVAYIAAELPIHRPVGPTRAAGGLGRIDRTVGPAGPRKRLDFPLGGARISVAGPDSGGAAGLPRGDRAPDRAVSPRHRSRQLRLSLRGGSVRSRRRATLPAIGRGRASCGVFERGQTFYA